MADYMKGNPASLEGVFTTGGNVGVSPILSFSVGTAGASRNWRFIQRMADAGRLHRIQSAVVYDYNQGTLDMMRRRMANSKGNYGTSVHLPEKVRAADGFLLNPYAFGEQLGVIVDDMDKMVAKMLKRTHEVGTPPQLIIEFLGFGGHAILGLLLHEKVRHAFPDAYCLPVVALPEDSTLQDWMRGELEQPPENVPIQEWMRHGTWKAYEKKLKPRKFEDCLIIDNRLDGPPNDALAMGLATISCAGSDAMKAGSIPEAVGGMRHEAQGWLGMSVVKRNLPARKGWASWFPLRRLKAVWSADDELPVQIKSAIKESLRQGGLLQMKAVTPSSNGSLNGSGQAGPRQAQSVVSQEEVSDNGLQAWPDNGLGRRIYVAVPVDDVTLRLLEKHILKQLKAENFWDTYPKAHIRFGAARFPERPEDDFELQGEMPAPLPVRMFRGILRASIFPATFLYELGRLALFGRNPKESELHAVVAALYPLPGRIARVDQILYGDASDATDGLRRTGETGFGTEVHASRPNGSKESQETAGQGPEDPRQSGPSEDETAQAQNGSAPHATADEEGGDPMPVGVPTVGAAEASEGETWAGGPVSEVSPEGDLNEQSDSEKVDSPGEDEDDSSEATP